jgi:predicted membrane metal-binding protein
MSIIVANPVNIATYGIPIYMWAFLAVISLVFFFYGIDRLQNKTFPATVTLLFAFVANTVTGKLANITYYPENIAIVTNETVGIVNEIAVVPTVTLINYLYISQIFYGLGVISLLLCLYGALRCVGLIGVTVTESG